MTFCQLHTAAGEVLSVQGTPASLCAGDAALAAIAVLPTAMRQICFIVASDGRPFRVEADPEPGVTASAQLLRTPGSARVRLRYPVEGLGFLVAGDGKAPRFDGNGDAPEAIFVLPELAADSVPAAARALAAEIGGAAANGLRAAPLLAALRDGSLRHQLAVALVRVMPRDELAELARLLLEQPEELALLRAAIPGDIWLGTQLPALFAWCAARTAAGVDNVWVSAAGEESALLPAANRAKLVPAGLVLNSLARKTVLPRRGACILATARNEGAYLLDWISYHLSIGFEHIFLYTNDNADGSDLLLARLAQAGVITWIRNECGPEMSPQLKCYAHALRMLPQILDYRWAAVLDLDEYVGFDVGAFDGFADFMAVQEQQSVDAVALSWLMFAGLSHDRWSADASPRRFTWRDRDPNPHVKSVIRPRLFWFSYPHDPVPVLGAPFDYRTQEGGFHHHPGVRDRRAFAAEHPSAEQAWINHYHLRSAEEALWKWSRGQGDQAASNAETRRPLEFIAATFLGSAAPESLVEDRRLLECARGQAALLDGLLRLPGVAACDAEIKARFGALLAANTQRFLATKLPDDASFRVRGFYDLVAEQQAAS